MKGNEFRVQERVLDLSKGKKELRRLVERSVGMHLKISCIHMVIEGHKSSEVHILCLRYVSRFVFVDIVSKIKPIREQHPDMLHDTR